MRFTFTKETITEAIKTVSSIGGKTLVAYLGAKSGDEQLCLNSFMSSTASELITKNVACEKPEGWDETKKGAVALNMAEVSGAVNALASFDADIYIDVTSGGICLGVEGLANVPLQKVDEVPDEIKPDASYFQFKASSKDFSAFIRRALSIDGGGINEASARLNMAKCLFEGASTDGNICTLGLSQFEEVIIPDEKKRAETLKNREDFLKATSQTEEAVEICFSKSALKNLKFLLDAKEANIGVFVSPKHLSFAIGATTRYIMTLADTSKVPVGMAEKIFGQVGGSAIMEMDSATLVKQVRTAKALIDLKGGIAKDVSNAMMLSFENGSAILSSALETDLKVKLSASSVKVKDSSFTMFLDGTKLISVTNALDKGTVTVVLADDRKKAFLFNGDVKNIKSSPVRALVLGINPEVVERAMNSSEENNSEGDEAEDESKKEEKTA